MAAPLVAGGFIYLLLRPGGLRMFDWAEAIGLGPGLAAARQQTLGWAESTPAWVRWSAPDALFAWSMTALMAALWGQRLHRDSAPWLVAGPLMTVGAELAQGLHVLPGTFDSVDLLLACAGCALGLRKVRFGRSNLARSPSPKATPAS